MNYFTNFLSHFKYSKPLFPTLASYFSTIEANTKNFPNPKTLPHSHATPLSSPCPGNNTGYTGYTPPSLQDNAWM